ncbi:MAG: PIN domain-containing protein [Methanobrevibacter sp.]|jgi:predicted nucleic acid-binding protein|nr:PIN domain-containing protein [Candidatus Methanovirga australis]
MIFLDTSFLVSFYINEEEDHPRANELMEKIKKEEKIISRIIIAETINLLNNKLKIDKHKIEETYTKLIEDYTIIEDHYFYNNALRKTIEWEKRLPFFDFLIMSIMEELGIKEIATFDKHFDLNKNIKRIY